jgi:drug/metabolite transporter (DMT)-like permease
MSSESSSTSYIVTIAAILTLPALACIVLMLADPGIKSDLLTSSFTHAVGIIAAAGVLSYLAHYLSTRSSQG